MKSPTKTSLRVRTKKALFAPALLVFTFSFLVACSEMAPILASAAMNFGRNLIDTASQNAGVKYGTEMEQLIKTLAYSALDRTQVKLQQQFPDVGSFAGSTFHTDPEDPYADEEFVTNMEAVGNVQLDVALLAQQKTAEGVVQMVPIADGDTLHDGRGDRNAGDKLKITFRSSCACYVYIVGIDATGYVAQIFPDRDMPATGNPVEAGNEYVLPEGDTWWGLDEYRGVETVYFVASPRQREDIESAVASLLTAPRSVSPRSYRPVTEAAVVPLPRGLVKVQDSQPVNISVSPGNEIAVTPTGFLATVEGAELVITRWFNHQ